MTKFKIFVETLTVCTLFVRSNLDKVGLRKLVLKKLVQTHANRHKRPSHTTTYTNNNNTTTVTCHRKTAPS